MVSKQIKSRERVAEHGEVFTNEREVNDSIVLPKLHNFNLLIFYCNMS